MILKVLTWISRILFGGVFIFAGFTKAIDPLGSAYKFEDYFLAFGMESLFPLALPLAILLNTVEFLVGFTILLGLKMRLSAWVGLLFMAFFTPLTLYIAITNPVPDCGCFGDAVIISNWDTFYKNVVILAAAILIFIRRDKIQPLWSQKKDGYLAGGLAILILWLSMHCLLNLPIIDFRPWKTGNDITQQLEPVQEEIVEHLFVYENTETGETRKFDMDNLPTDEEWEYVDREQKLIQEYIPSPIENFVIEDEFGQDLTWDIISNPGYQLLVVAYDLKRTHQKAFTGNIKETAMAARHDGIDVITLTSSTFSDIQHFKQEHDLDWTFFQSDERELKTIIRSNPGLVLLQNGVVIEKWHHRNIPSYDSMKDTYLKD